MLLKSIQATNFMKYKNLEIADLPAKGIIGIFGENESGKSTIGQAVAFALFGTTTRFQQDTLIQAIHWDADESEVQVCFSLDDTLFKVVRTLDRKGNQQAALYKGEKETAVKKGAANVTREIERLTRFNFDNFRSTFYLAQKEIDLIMKQIQTNASDMIYRMLGFDVLTQACEILDKEVLSLITRREKTDNEILLSRSLISNVKTDNSEEKSVNTQLQELRENKKKLENKLAEIETDIAKAQEILDSRQKLSDSFAAIEKSFVHSFYKEKLAQSLQFLSALYAVLSEERSRIAKNRGKLQKDEDNLQQRLQDLSTVAKEIDNIKNMVQVHGRNLQRRISASDKKDAADDNLQIAISRQERKISQIAAAGLAAFAFCGMMAVLMLLLLVTGAWVSTLVALLLSIGSFIGVFSLRRKLKDAQGVLAQLAAEREHVQQQLELCLHFPAHHTGEMEKSLAQLAAPEIGKKFQELRKQFSDIFAASPEVEPLICQAQQDRDLLHKQQKALDERSVKLDSLSKLMESLVKEINFQSSPREEDYKMLEDLEALEKNIYASLETIQNYRAALREFEGKMPAEIPQVWQEYEAWRNKFRTLTNSQAVGGGTGMLNRLESAFRQKTVDKLLAALTSEREGFFSLLPTMDNLRTNVQKNLDAKSFCQEEIADCQRRLKDAEAQSVRVGEDLERKKDLIAKVQALNRQLQEMDHNIELNRLAIKLMQDTLGSVSSRFAPSVSRVMSKVLPKVTKERYQHVQVSENLTLKAFSIDKNDFVDLAELSGGTVDQLYLALRLALSQAVMTAKMGSDCTQFLFFDEPIISFDEDRSTSFLTLLGDYNKNFVQVFVIAPRAYQEDLFDLTIRTTLNQNELVIAGKEAPAPVETSVEMPKNTAREAKDTPREAKEPPREAKEPPREAKENTRDTKEPPRDTKESPRESREGIIPIKSKATRSDADDSKKQPGKADDIQIEYDKDA